MSASELAAAVRLHRDGQPQAAAERLRSVLAAGSTDIRVFEAYAGLLLELGDRDGAVRALRRAVKVGSADADIALRLARGFVAAQAADDALALLGDGSQLISPDAFALLAAAQGLRGNTTAQAAALERAVALAPENAALRRSLAAAQAGAGQVDAAIETLDAAVASAPDDTRAWNNLGALRIRAGQLDQAVVALETALALRNDYAAAAANLAVALHRLGRLDAARAQAQRAMGLGGNINDAQIELAAICMAAGDYPVAESALNAVLQKQPASEAARIALAELRELQGRYEEGFALVGELAGHATDAVNARLVAASLARRLKRLDEALVLLQPLIGTNGLPSAGLDVTHRRRLGFLLGDIHDANGNPAQALAAYDFGNAAAGRSFDAAANSARVDAIIQRFDSTAVPGFCTTTASVPRPLFIVGMPRSGTSLLETMLDRHPDVHAAGELAIVGRFAARSDAMMDGDSESGVAKEMALAWLAATRTPDGVRVVTDKMPLNYLHIGWIARALPNALVLHLSRDPCDLLLSCYRQDFLDPELAFSFDLGNLCRYWRDYCRLMQHWHAVAADRLLPVSYEALVTQPEETLHAILSFVGLEFSPRCLEPHKSGRSAATASHAQVRAPLHDRSIGTFDRYRAALGPRAADLESLRCKATR